MFVWYACVNAFFCAAIKQNKNTFSTLYSGFSWFISSLATPGGVWFMCSPPPYSLFPSQS